LAEQATQSPASVPRALEEPSQRVRWRWVSGLSLASLVMWMANQTPANILIPIQLGRIDPSGAKTDLGLIFAVAAVASVLATPIAGAISDRTSHARSIGPLRGRRHRWTLLYALLGAVCLAAIGPQKTVLAVGALWVLFSAFQNGEYATLSAAIPDHVPVKQRATVAGWFSMPQALGLVVGSILVTAVFTTLPKGYLALAIALAVLTVPFLFTPDYPLLPEHTEPLRFRALLDAFWVSPRQYPDFGWAWLTRFLNALAIAMGTLYLLYFLHDKVQYYKHFHQYAKQGLLILILIYTGCVVLTAIGGGMISDRLGKRKMIVTVAGLLMAVAALLLTFVETWHAAIGAAVLYGVGFGAYLAVDQALITQVLPAAADRAKDLGIINIAIVGPTALAGVISPVLVILGGPQHGYQLLFAGTAVVAIAGSVLVWKIKSVP
jgi:MFS family permease